MMKFYGITPKAKYKSYKGDMNGTTKNQLLTKVIDEENHKTYYERDFETSKCNEVWSTDVSEFHIAAGKLYLSPIIDFHNREIISYNISTSPNFEQTKDMLAKAFQQYDDLNGLILHSDPFQQYDDLNGLILHSDQGWQYQMQPYHQMFNDKGICQSMSRKGNCLDNSPMENFFVKVKNEMFYGKEYTFETLDELRIAMEEYIEY